MWLLVMTIVIAAVVISAVVASYIASSAPRKHKRGKVQKHDKGFFDRFGTMNFILVLIGVVMLIFTVTMTVLFCIYGTIPDTLVTCVFSVLGGECGIMGWIRTSKERHRERKWEVEDRSQAKEEHDNEQSYEE